MSTEEYNQAVKRLVNLMKAPKISTDEKKELEKLLDQIDSYNSLDFLKVGSH